MTRMLIAASVCPSPPALVPAMTAAAPDWLTELRVVAHESVRRLVAADADRIIAVGVGRKAGFWSESAGGSLLAFGVDASFGGPQVGMPLALTVAAHLLDDAGWAGARSYVCVPAGESALACSETGRELAAGEERIGLLVMGDGSAKRSTTAPGYLDERAAAYDEGIAAALGDVDCAALLALEPGLAQQLWVAGRVTWQVLAGAAGLSARGTMTGCVSYNAAPRGVGYFVANWVSRPSS